MAQTTIQGSFLGDATVTGAKVAADFISAQTALTTGLATTDEIIVSDAGVIKRMDISVLEIAASQITASGTLPALNGAALTALNGTQVTSGTLPAARIAADSIVEGKLNVSNGPTNGHVLTARDGVAGGFTWEAAAGGGVDTTGTPASNHIAIFHDNDTLKSTANFTFDNWPVVKRSAGTGETFAIEGFNDANYHTRLVIRKSQHDTIDTMTVLDSDQSVGEISFQGASGTSAGNWGTGAAIRVDTSNNAWSGNACPAMMRFYTCPDGGSEPLQRVMIKSTGNVEFSDSIYIGRHNGNASNKNFGFHSKNTQSVSTSLTYIITAADSMTSQGALIFVAGRESSGSTKKFYDLLMHNYRDTSSSPTVISSTVANGASGRTYDQNNGGLRLRMASGTYDVAVLCIEAPNVE